MEIITTSQRSAAPSAQTGAAIATVCPSVRLVSIDDSNRVLNSLLAASPLRVPKSRKLSADASAA